jgi:hypothetical protein
VCIPFPWPHSANFWKNSLDSIPNSRLVQPWPCQRPGQHASMAAAHQRSTRNFVVHSPGVPSRRDPVSASLARQ